ncbi:hypothetical protein HG531_008270 [Fusarium graminearum]|nr:hypothetical protein HG531_008270 [Fusarium graminearum]
MERTSKYSMLRKELSMMYYESRELPESKQSMALADILVYVLSVDALLLHKASFTAYNGVNVTPGNHISYLCHNRAYFNPLHLVEETAQQNNARKGCTSPLFCPDHGHLIWNPCELNNHHPAWIAPRRAGVVNLFISSCQFHSHLEHLSFREILELTGEPPGVCLWKSHLDRLLRCLYDEVALLVNGPIGFKLNQSLARCGPTSTISAGYSPQSTTCTGCCSPADDDNHLPFTLHKDQHCTIDNLFAISDESTS